jgi:hypothetical protein
MAANIAAAYFNVDCADEENIPCHRTEVGLEL